MKPVFAGCETNGRLRRTLLECLTALRRRDLAGVLHEEPLLLGIVHPEHFMPA